MKKVIEQGKGYLDIQHLTKTISVYQRFGLNPNGVFIIIDKPKAREAALAICPELKSELAEKDKEIKKYKKAVSDFALSCSKLNNAKSYHALENIVLVFFDKIDQILNK